MVDFAVVFRSAEAAASWDWDNEARALGATADGTYNAGAIRFKSHDTIVWWLSDGSTKVYSGRDVERIAEEIAAVLALLGVRKGDRVAGLLSRRPEAFAAAMGVWRLGAIYVPLFSGFGGDGLRVRLEDCAPKVTITDPPNRQGLATALEVLPSMELLVIGGEGHAGDAEFDQLRQRSFGTPAVAETGLHETSTIMYTSGTTGRPKGCTIPHRAVVTLQPYVRHCLAVGAGDRLFSGADAGWSFGLFTTGLAPMAVGVSRVVYEAPFSAEGWWDCVRQLNASHVAAAPTAFRQLAAAGTAMLPPQFQAGTSAGEPLDSSTVAWFKAATGVVIRDSYGLTELGMIIASLREPPGQPIVTGSLGTVLPGFEVRLLDTRGEEVQGTGEGRVSVRDNGYFLSSGYWQRQAEWDARFADGWFVTEDVARRDVDGSYRYVGRSDDVIVSAGYNIGPLEVESALLEHPLVIDAACVGEPDSTKGQVVAAYVVLNGPAPDDLLAELRPWVGKRVGWYAAPRRVHVRSQLPRTASGKLQRNVLRSETRAR